MIMKSSPGSNTVGFMIQDVSIYSCFYFNWKSVCSFCMCFT